MESSLMYNGYPDRDDLEKLATFYGTPEGLTDEISYLVEGYGGVKSENSGTDVEVRIVTGGWSGNEDVIGVLERGLEGNSTTMFSMAYWDSSHRGGLHVYRIPQEHWDSPRFLGDVLKFKDAS